MGLFDLFKKPKQIDDPVLGSLKENGSTWRGSAVFRPTGSQVEIIISSSKVPGEEYGIFYRTVESRYGQMMPEISAIIQEYIHGHQADLVIQDFGKEFAISSIHIDDLDIKPEECDISYDTVHDELHTFTVTIRDMKLQSEVIHH